MSSVANDYREDVLIMPPKRGRPAKNTIAVPTVDNVVPPPQQLSAPPEISGVISSATACIETAATSSVTEATGKRIKTATKRKAVDANTTGKKVRVTRSRKGRAVAIAVPASTTINITDAGASQHQPVIKKERKKREPKVKKAPVHKPKPERKKRPAVRLPHEASIYLSASMRGRVLRAMKQRMFVLSRQLSLEDDSVETFDVIGSVGNTYKVCIGHNISCECMDYRIRRTHCKHILMVLLKIYRLPYDSPLFKSMRTNREQRLIARSTGRMVDPSVLVPLAIRERILRMTHHDHPDLALSEDIKERVKEEEEQLGNRRPLDTSDCPICFEAFEEQTINLIDFCKVCGNNIHTECFNMWRSSKGDRNVTCVYCRSAWVFPTENSGSSRGPSKRSIRELDPDHIFEGVPNFAKELGLARTRDTSTYSRGPRYGYSFEY